MHQEIQDRLLQASSLWLIIATEAHTVIYGVSAVQDFILQMPASDPNSLLLQHPYSGIHWLLTYMPWGSWICVAYTPMTTTLTVTALGQQQWLLLVVYLQFLANFILGHCHSYSYQRNIHLPPATLLQVSSSTASAQMLKHNLETFNPRKW